jgi:hypothetical protein
MTSDQNKLMDVIFEIDATGSMTSTIKATHDKAADIAINLRVKNPDVDFMFGSVCYRDPIDSGDDVHELHQLDSDINRLVAFFSAIKPTGGGDSPEDWVGAYRLALDNIEWRDGAKAIVHIADAPAHGQQYCGYANHEEESGKLEPLIREVAKRKILVTCLDINEAASCSFSECQRLYEEAGGPQFTIELMSLRGGSGVPEPRMVKRNVGSSLFRGFNCCCGAAPPGATRVAPAARHDVIETQIHEATEAVCEMALVMQYGD